MARPTEGWQLRWRRGIAFVRFTHAGKRVELSTGERDPRAAAKKASAIYADAVARRILPKPRRAVARGETEDAVILWLQSLEETHDVRTVESYGQYAAKWIERWPLLADITTERIDVWMRERLREVQARTLRKWTTALRSLLAWCVANHLMIDAPRVNPIPRRTVGKVARPRRDHPDITAEEIERVLAHLPVLSEREMRGRDARCPVRAWFRVLWETGLRPSTLLELEAPIHYRRGGEELIIAAGADKTRFARRLPLTQAARDALDEVCPDVGRLFVSRPGRDHLRNAAQAAGLPPAMVAALVPYTLRHARITHLLDVGASILGVQYLAGHKHLSTTEKYVRTAHRHAVAALAKTGPDVSGAAPPELTSKEKNRGKS